MSEFQTKIQEAFQQAQAKATARARELDQEARKVLETLTDRAQAQLVWCSRRPERAAKVPKRCRPSYGTVLVGSLLDNPTRRVTCWVTQRDS